VPRRHQKDKPPAKHKHSQTQTHPGKVKLAHVTTAKHSARQARDSRHSQALPGGVSMSAHFGLLADVPGSSLRLRLTGEFISSAAAGPPPAAPPPPAGVRQLAVRHSECAATEIDNESEDEIPWCNCCRAEACEEASPLCRQCAVAVRELRLLARRQDACDVLSIALEDYPEELGEALVREYRFSKKAVRRGGRRFDLRSWLTRQQPADGPSLKRRR